MAQTDREKTASEPVGEQVATASAHEVAAVEPVIRRVVAARVVNSADIDDLVQDCLVRLLTARGRLAPEAVLPYAVVTARNLVTSHTSTTARRAAAAPRIVDARQPDRPEDAVLAGESSRAMTAALARLTDQERSDILAYYSDGLLGGGEPQSRGALRVRMSRTRAKLRLEYLLAFRHVEPPSPLCRRVLLAVSAGDTRRQRDLHAGQHLLDCETCAALSEPLERRSIALTAFTVPAGIIGWALTKARARPVHTATAVTASSAVIAASAIILAHVLSGSPAARKHVRPPIPPPPHPAARSGVISQLTINGLPVADTEVQRSIRSMIGQSAAASGVNVEAVVAHNGFWVGSPRARIWVELVGPLEPLRILAGDHLRFHGTVVGNSASYPAQIGVTGSGSAGLLARQGAHIAVSTTSISVAG